MATRTAGHPNRTILVALAVATVTAVVIACVAGLRAVGDAFAHMHRSWIWLAVAVQSLSLFEYVIVYRSVVREVGAHRLAAFTSLDLVLTGFGPLSPAGGFASDERSLVRLGLTPRRTRHVVIMLGSMELLALVWIAFAAAVVALVVDPSLGAAFTWPWIAGVPLGTAAAIALSRHERLAPGRLRPLVGPLRDVLTLARHPQRLGLGWAAIVVYWLADMTALGFALRALHLTPEPEVVVLAYATGYIVSRRTLPFGGAGLIELLMTLSLTWVHEPLASALAAVVLYRGIDLGLVSVRATIARLRLEPKLDAPP